MSPHELVICTYCDAVHQRPALATSSTARCATCNGVLYHTNPAIGAMLVITVTATIAFVIANMFPLITLTSGGFKIEATLWHSIVASYDQDLPLVAVVLAATLIFAPLFELGLLLWVLVPLNLDTRPFGFRTVMRLMHILRPWRMVEVFLLGVLVALVKLGSLATAVPGWGVFGVVLITVSLASLGYFDRGELWRRVDAIQANQAQAVAG